MVGVPCHPVRYPPLSPRHFVIFGGVNTIDEISGKIFWKIGFCFLYFGLRNYIIMSEKIYVRKVESWTIQAASEPIEVNVDKLRNCEPPYDGNSDEELAK